MKNIIWSLTLACGLVVLAAGICSAQAVLYFPQFVDGSLGAGYWGTVIAVTNPAGLGTPAANCAIAITQDDGTPVNIAFTDENGRPVGNIFQLAGGQSKYFMSPKVTANTFVPFNVGFATVTSDLPITGTSVYLAGNGNGPYAMAGVPPATPLTRQVVFAGSFTALAVANPGLGTANITFQLVDQSGNPVVPQVALALAANNHTAFFASDLFPNAPSSTYGTMRITSDVPIVSTALAFQQNDGTFGTLPVFPLQ